MASSSHEPMLDLFMFETNQLIEQLEQDIISSEKTNSYSTEAINEIFRIMHTIKGSSAMMLFNNLSSLAHSIEDLFFYIRENSPQNIDYSTLSDLVLEGVDFIRLEMVKLKNGDQSDGDSTSLISTIKDLLIELKKQNGDKADTKKQKPPVEEPKKEKFYVSQDKTQAIADSKSFKAIIHFEEDCEMENIRAFTTIHNIEDFAKILSHVPKDVIGQEDASEVIRNDGLSISFKTSQNYEQIHKLLSEMVYIKNVELFDLDEKKPKEEIIPEVIPEIIFEEKQIIEEPKKKAQPVPNITEQQKDALPTIAHASMISVDVSKLDKLMDLVGELVITEAMVTQNQDLKDLILDNFSKAARQLQKITGELQDTVMSIRMVPINATFHKMDRIVRDMSKKLNKDVHLEIIGENTEVDKNIIEHISDPLIHLVRNSIDHGIEAPEEREKAGKTEHAKVILEARNDGGEVLIFVRDNGKGLNKEKILQKAVENNLIHRPINEMSDREIYSLILLPGFSTKDNISEYSGRGVGMDIVTKNIETVGGTVQVESVEGHGTTITLKIPLTLAIVDGMNIRVGKSKYTIPTTSIKESFRIKESDVIRDPDLNEMLMVRGKCIPILRLKETFKVNSNVDCISDGIVIMVESNSNSLCLFADELIGEQQVVVKSLPKYFKKIKGVAGCTLLGDGGISLILDICGLMGY